MSQLADHLRVEAVAKKSKKILSDRFLPLT